MNLNKGRTERGFQLIEFEDCYNQKCSIQKSPTVKEQVMFGANDVSYDGNDEPYNSKTCLDRKASFKIAIRLIIFALTGNLYKEKKVKQK